MAKYTRIQQGSGTQCHDCHERLHQHSAVTDQAGVALTDEHFRRGARGDQSVETR